MTDNVQYSVNGWSAAIEPCAVASWPAREAFSLDGWFLRFTGGFSSRSNSAATNAYNGASLECSIEAAEAAYRARGLPPQFQIAPTTRPENLEAVLVARGYTHKTPTWVMVAETAALAAFGDVRIACVADDDFARLTREGSHSPADGEERLSTLARAPAPKGFFTAHAGGTAVSCGASVVTGAWAGVFVMRTTPVHRRAGHGRRVLGAIAAWAEEQGAARLYLQVDETNAAGRALYARAGFQDAYRYKHYVAK
ncbi:MAG TPA: GNAT family N-acetyltransferase [Rhizomicrobium sp.]|jgi:GNAT superfamily N-acetyltransferase|nr:GNAT family N-acetyltransferase [Rhizomicrobium sp.]